MAQYSNKPAGKRFKVNLTISESEYCGCTSGLESESDPNALTQLLNNLIHAYQLTTPAESRTSNAVNGVAKANGLGDATRPNRNLSGSKNVTTVSTNTNPRVENGTTVTNVVSTATHMNNGTTVANVVSTATHMNNGTTVSNVVSTGAHMNNGTTATNVVSTGAHMNNGTTVNNVVSTNAHMNNELVDEIDNCFNEHVSPATPTQITSSNVSGGVASPHVSLNNINVSVVPEDEGNNEDVSNESVDYEPYSTPASTNANDLICISSDEEGENALESLLVSDNENQIIDLTMTSPPSSPRIPNLGTFTNEPSYGSRASPVQVKADPVCEEEVRFTSTGPLQRNQELATGNNIQSYAPIQPEITEPQEFSANTSAFFPSNFPITSQSAVSNSYLSSHPGQVVSNTASQQSQNVGVNPLSPQTLSSFASHAASFPVPSGFNAPIVIQNIFIFSPTNNQQPQ